MPVSINLYVPTDTKARLIEQHRNPKNDSWYDVSVSDLPPSTDWNESANKNKRFIIQEVN